MSGEIPPSARSSNTILLEADTVAFALPCLCSSTAAAVVIRFGLADDDVVVVSPASF